MIYDNLFRDIATIVADKCVNPETKRPYTLSMIEKALRDAHFSVNPAKGAKQQALKAVELLKRSLPIERAQMTVRVTVPAPEGKAMRSLLLDTMRASLDGESHFGDAYSVDATLEPGFYKQLEAEVASRARGRGTVEVMALAVLTDDMADGDGVGGSGAGGDDGADGLAAGVGRMGMNEAGVASSGHGGSSAASGSGVGTSAAGSGLDATTAASRGTGMMVRRVTQPGRRLACGACASSFDSSEEHREHHRSDWHRFNLKRKMKALEPVTAEAFAALPAKEVKAFIEDYD